MSRFVFFSDRNRPERIFEDIFHLDYMGKDFRVRAHDPAKDASTRDLIADSDAERLGLVFEEGRDFPGWRLRLKGTKQYLPPPILPGIDWGAVAGVFKAKHAAIREALRLGIPKIEHLHILPEMVEKDYGVEIHSVHDSGFVVYSQDNTQHIRDGQWKPQNVAKSDFFRSRESAALAVVKNPPKASKIPSNPSTASEAGYFASDQAKTPEQLLEEELGVRILRLGRPSGLSADNRERFCAKHLASGWCLKTPHWSEKEYRVFCSVEEAIAAVRACPPEKLKDPLAELDAYFKKHLILQIYPAGGEWRAYYWDKGRVVHAHPDGWIVGIGPYWWPSLPELWEWLRKNPPRKESNP